MSNDQKALEVKVGLFVFIGLLAIAVMAVQFGRLGQGLTKFYPLNVEFQNASGLVKNADVQLSGAIIGHVMEKPRIVEGRVGSVLVSLEIQEGIKLPRNSTFVIGSSGLLGDKFVQITPPANFDAAGFDPSNPEHVYRPGELIVGTVPAGISELTEKLNARLEEVGATIKGINAKLPLILSNENISNLSTTFANLKTASGNFSEASGKVNDLLSGAQDVIASAKKTVGTAEKTMSTADAAASDIRLAIGDVRQVTKNAGTLLETAQNGSGTIPLLLSNRETADNIRALLANIRKHGLLFYRDSHTTDTELTDAPSPQKNQRR